MDRPEVGEFVELPAIGVRAVGLLDAGTPVGVAEERIATEYDVELDLVDLVSALGEAGLAAEIDGRRVDDPHRSDRPHLPRLRAVHVSWLFGPAAKVAYVALVAVTLATVVRRPELLVIGYVRPHPLVEGLLSVVVLVVVMSMALQLHVYMRTDCYFVLLDLLRCRNLFQDGFAYARHLARRVLHTVLPDRVAASAGDPTADLPPHERRAVRIYAVTVVAGSTVALSSFVAFGIPIVVHGAIRAGSAVLAGMTGGSLLAAVDGAVVILVEGTPQVIFLVTFYRRHSRRRRRAPSGRGSRTQPAPAG
ncbi:hypothetical protein [Micromonospora sp. DT31]|uniref:hypothetical protein n=1 Tax=Micromonospora sp. DT31 TaxID=3393434 RepID=UPI003CF9F824